MRIKPVQSYRTRAAPPRAVPRPIPKVTKTVLIDIMVPLDSGTCSRIRLVVAGKLVPKMKPPTQLRMRIMAKSFKNAIGIKSRLEATKVDTIWRFRPIL